MIPPIPNTLPPDPRRDIEELLPWYVNGTLDPAETAAVEQYLAQYPARRAELEQCRALAGMIEAHDPPAWQPAPEGFDRLMAEVNRWEAAPVSTPAQIAPSLWQQVLEWLWHTPPPVRWTLAVESLAIAVLVLAVLLPATMPAGPGYETLSNGEAPANAAGWQVRVVFDDRMSIGELQTLLRSITGHIAAGPTALGVYTVTIPSGEPPEGALDRAVTTLRAHPRVRLVEPLGQ
ncbi:MAG TPA: hypothetical protein P5149_13095 [Candidatus Competibacteraceae bacterium]|nr:hypothetical protein [Candidatus Competibacteraceae bacterium]MCP5132863.1 hypothetical protein [Gammaproteobacteria bacterium]HPF58303.1 hypothetical protein [Candidatus Competibacteraceae bacterium]HRY19326.1 hypothetical protein [Candidatus Competibacteraceae bacterium]